MADFTYNGDGTITVNSTDLMEEGATEFIVTFDDGSPDQVLTVLYRPACGDRTFMLYWVDKFGLAKQYPFGVVANEMESKEDESYIMLNDDYTTTPVYRHSAERTIELHTGLIESDEYDYCATVLTAQKAWYFDKYGIERVVLIEGEADDTDTNYKNLEIEAIHEEKTIR